MEISRSRRGLFLSEEPIVYGTAVRTGDYILTPNPERRTAEPPIGAKRFRMFSGSAEGGAILRLFSLSRFLVGFTDVGQSTSNPLEHLSATFPAFIVASLVMGANPLADPFVGSLLCVAGNTELVHPILPGLLFDIPDNIVETSLPATCHIVELGPNPECSVADFPPFIPGPVCHLPVEPARPQPPVDSPSSGTLSVAYRLLPARLTHLPFEHSQILSARISAGKAQTHGCSRQQQHSQRSMLYHIDTTTRFSNKQLSLSP